MSDWLRTTYNILVQFGIDPRKCLRSMRGLPLFLWDLLRYRQLSQNRKGALQFGRFYPILHDRFGQSGEASGHYFHQDLWAARKVYKFNPRRHVDIGSSVSGFVSHLLVFRDVEVIDVRPLQSDVSGLRFIQSDATQLFEFENNSLESISTLHAAEHFGLGRYGDPVDPTAHLTFMAALTRVLKPGGRLYFAVPSGIEKLYFNAHRVLSPETVLEGFKGLTLVSFAWVNDAGVLIENAKPQDVRNENYGCGLFEFTK